MSLPVSSSSSSAPVQSMEVDHTASLPDELLAHLFSFLPTLRDLEVCCLSSRRWYAVARDARVKERVSKNQKIIDPDFWNKNVGKVEEAKMPRELMQYLFSPCPIQKGKESAIPTSSHTFPQMSMVNL